MPPAEQQTDVNDVAAPPTGRPLPAPVALVLAAHPARALAVTVALAVAAAVTGRPGREVALVAATVAVGQLVLGWVNDVADADLDARHRRRRKPVADGRLERGTAGFAAACAVLVLVPLSVANGLVAAGFYLASVAIGVVGTRVGRRGPASWWPWALAWALYPGFLSYGGWGGLHVGEPPHPLAVGLAALAGVGVHVLTAVWGLVDDRDEGWDTLPLRLGLGLGANRLLALTVVFLAAVAAGLLWLGVAAPSGT
ncbi:UbiA family prenyltransferase [Nocardioides bruguierae]|uniref:UbiA family prenyltransferase n=1 Tax=Nocardioides bruguierae TaxID=2945102 RepID=A0A9X2DDB0_9ACTN|nr:UbiA family prenyltransferase [Nocardioides bruguierae]MCL8024110.1 UbiA family prenyltransferase [Nocardioides bruguierae]MCM0622364.1 UbiA family prenyltransferase [Nocardioides bruguierae]